MLVLTRKPQEKIRIGDDITITVIKTKGKGVRLGIEAPNHVPVLRGELTEQDEPQPTPAEEPQVGFTRVSKSRIGSVLPDVLGEPGPLRGMLARRAESPV